MLTLLSVGLAVLAVQLGVSGPPAGRARSRLSTPDATGGATGRSTRLAPGLAVAFAVAVGVSCTFVVGGARAGVASLAGAIVLTTAYRLARAELADRRRLHRQLEVAHGCELVAAQLRVGRVPADAVTSAAEDCAILRPGARLLALGGDPTTAWREAGQQPGCRGLLDLAAGWQVSYRTGAPLAPLLEQVSDALAADLSLRRTISGEVSAPRATAKIMAALPAFGLGLGYLIGGRPLAFLMEGPPGWACLLLGCLLAAAGVTWMERLARLVAQEAG